MNRWRIMYDKEGGEGGDGAAVEDSIRKIMREAREEQAAEERAAKERAERERAAAESKEPDWDELLESENKSEAIKILKGEIQKDTLQLVGPLAQQAARGARAAARDKIGQEAFDKYYTQAKELLAEDGMNLDLSADENQILKAIAYARSSNIDDELASVREQARREAAEEYAQHGFMPYAGEGSHGDEETRNAVKDLSEDERYACDALGFDAKTFASHKKSLEDFRDPLGFVEDAPIMDEDLDFKRRSRRGRPMEREIRPGSF